MSTEICTFNTWEYNLQNEEQLFGNFQCTTKVNCGIVRYLAVYVGGTLFDHTAIAAFSFRILNSGIMEPITYPSPHSLATSKVSLSLGEARMGSVEV